MRFDYPRFINELRRNPKKAATVEKYEHFIGPLGQRPMENIISPIDNSEVLHVGEKWYNDLVRPFPKISSYAVPVGLEDDYNFDLLGQLAAASLSSEALLEPHRNKNGEYKIRLKFTCKNEDITVTRYIDNLWGFQIQRLFEIWVLENIVYCVLWNEDKKEKEGIRNAKLRALKHWNKQLKFIKRFPVLKG